MVPAGTETWVEEHVETRWGPGRFNDSLVPKARLEENQPGPNQLAAHSASAKDLSLRSLADTTTSTRPRAWRLPGPSVRMSGAACARRACKTSPRYIYIYIYRGDQEDEYDGGQTSSLFSEETSLTRGGIHIMRKWYNEISSVFKDRPPF